MKQRIDLFLNGQNAAKTLFGMGAYLKKSPVESSLFELIEFRVSQINGCAYCLDMHYKEAIQHGETELRLYSLSAWRETPYYTDREQAGLAWAEAVNACEVPDAVYNEARQQFSEEELIDLTLLVVAINSWNRLNIAFKTTPGTYVVGQFS
jgi:AhpD family alkylhydroperoxidase